MNALGYQLGRLARFFGIRREKKRISVITRESKFLQEAIDLLGRAAWQDASQIDDLAVEFYQIRDAEKRQRELRARLDTLRSTSASLDFERGEIETRFSKELDDLKESKTRAMAEALELMRKSDALKAGLETLKRRFAGQKLKLKAIEDGGDDRPEGDSSAVEAGLDELKNAYTEKSAEIDTASAALKAVEASITATDHAIEAKRAALKSATSDVIGRIGKVSKEYADISAEIGALQNAKNALANRVGRFLTQNIESPTQEVKLVLRKHRALASKILYFRRSINYQQRLVRGI